MKMDLHRRDAPYHPFACSCSECEPRGPADAEEHFGFRDWFAFTLAGLAIGGALDLTLHLTGYGPRLAHWLGLI